MNLELTNTVALVTASSRGIGKAIAQGLSAEGCHVILCSRNIEQLQNTAREIRQATHNPVTTFQVDFTCQHSLAHFLESLWERFDALDILVNNVGGPPCKPHAEVSTQEWQDVFQSTFLSTVTITEACIPKMHQRSGGRIIFVASVAAKQPGILVTNAYRASVAVYAKTLSNELGKDQILVNTVCPSYVITDKFYEVADELAARQHSSRERVIADWMQQVPLQRPALPDEVAHLVVFLASSKASYITGACIQIDGGFVKSVF